MGDWSFDLMVEVRSPFTRGRTPYHGRPNGGFSESESDISFVSSDRPSTDRVSTSMLYDPELAYPSRLSTSSENSYGSFHLGPKFTDLSYLHDVSSASQESGHTATSWSSQNMVTTLN